MFRFSNRKALAPELKCRVLLLVPNEELEIGYAPNSTGQDIMNEVVKQLDLLDKDYYGLKVHDQIQWLDLTKTIAKQTKGMQAPIFELRFKYYPAEPALLANESTRYYLYLQLRLDLIEGRLLPDSIETTAYLIACILQSELGDYTSSPNTPDNYVSEFKFIPNQTEDLEWAAIRLHQNEDFQGLKPADSELNFLKKACQLDTYGVDPYPVKEGNSHRNFLIGVNHRGVSTFHLDKRINLFGWSEIERIALDNKVVIIYYKRIEKKGEKTSKTKGLLGFRCHSTVFAHNFWKIACEHKYFFTLETSPEAPIITNTGGLFKKNHKLKYIGRVEKDLLKDSVDQGRSCGVKRSHSLMAKTNDGPMWQGFEQGHNLQTSLNNIYSNDFINKTMPSDMNFFREEDEDEFVAEGSGSGGGVGGVGTKNSIGTKQASARHSLASMSKDSPKTFTRRPVMTTKTEASGSAIRRGSQIYMDTNHENNEFIRASIVLFVILVASLLVMLLINESDRPTTISLLIKKMNLESVSHCLRNNYYLPLKSALRNSFSGLVSVLDAKLL